jgi:penicillin-binding protein 1A
MTQPPFQKLSEYFKSRPKLSRITKFTLWGILSICLVFVFIYLIVYFSIPSRSELRYVQNNTASEIYSSDGVLLGKYYIQDRTNVSYENIAPHVINALVATEDVRFYKHKGIDTRGMFRVAFKSILMQDESSGGGSTISQQLAKNLFPRKKYWILSLPLNKLREMILAGKIEDVFSKEEIITLYLNTVAFGENAYGIATASKRFFNTTPAALKIEEGAVLIGMLKATTSYNPKRNPDRAKGRRNVVLNQMEKYGYLTSIETDSLSEIPLVVKYNYSTHSEGLATYFREQIRLELQHWLEENKKEDGTTYNLYTDGLKIYTTIDSKMQKHAELAVRQQMGELQKSFNAHWGKKFPWGNNKDVVIKAKQRSQRYKLLKEEGFSDEEIDENFKTPVSMKLFSYKGEVIKKMTPLDSIRYNLNFLHPGFLAIDTKTGHVKAWVGGIDYRYFKYDHVNINTKRQVGSTFKPIVYATALQKGVNPCEYIQNEKTVYAEYENWSPRNADNTYGGMYSMQGGLTNSVNTISANLMMKAGIENVRLLAKQMGIQSPLDPVPSLALGTADISLFEMVTAFNVFANRGVYIEPKYILKIEDNTGKVVKDFSKEDKRYRVLSQDKADMMVKMLQNVVDHGTGARLRYRYALEGDMAGKTGTTQAHADGWFIGFTPKIVAGAWVGGEDRRIHFRSLDLGQGASTALPIWGSFMSRVYKDPKFKEYKKAKFPAPSDDVLALLACTDFIPPDSTDSSGIQAWWPFSKNDKNDSARELKREQRKERRENTYAQKKEEPSVFKRLFGRRKD